MGIRVTWRNQDNSPKKPVDWFGVVSRRGNAVLNPSPTKLQRLRSVLFDKETDLGVICKAFVDYSSVEEYAVFQNSVSGGRVLSLVSKRGNVKYASVVKKRFEELIVPFELKSANDNFVVDGRTSVLYEL